jgi:hypothetical protein
VADLGRGVWELKITRAEGQFRVVYVVKRNGTRTSNSRGGRSGDEGGSGEGRAQSSSSVTS